MKITASELHLLLQMDSVYGVKANQIETTIENLRGNPLQPENYDVFRRRYSLLPCKNDRQREFVLMLCALFPLKAYQDDSLLRWDAQDFLKNWHGDFHLYIEQINDVFEQLGLRLPTRLQTNLNGSGVSSRDTSQEQFSISDRATGFDFVYQGRQILIKKLKGTRYIVELIRNQGATISAPDLFYTIDPPDSAAVSPLSAIQSENEQSHTLTCSINPPYLAIDEATYHAVKNKIGELKEKIAIAQSSGQVERAEELQGELDSYSNYLRQNTKPNGQIDLVNSSDEKVSRSVAQAIRDALERHIKPVDEALATHLKECIKQDRGFKYEPALPTAWKIT